MSVTSKLVKVGIEAVEGAKGKIVSQLDVALESIAKKGQNLSEDRIVPALKKYGVKDLEIERSNVEGLAFERSYPNNVPLLTHLLENKDNADTITKMIASEMSQFGEYATTKRQISQYYNANLSRFSPELRRIVENRMFETDLQTKLTPDQIRNLMKKPIGDNSDLTPKEVVKKNFKELIRDGQSQELSDIIVKIGEENPDLKSKNIYNLLQEFPDKFPQEMKDRLLQGAEGPTGFKSARHDIKPNSPNAETIQNNYAGIQDEVLVEEIRQATIDVRKRYPDIYNASGALEVEPEAFSDEAMAALTKGVNMNPQPTLFLEDNSKAFSNYSLPNTNHATYNERVYSAAGLPSLNQKSGHFNTPNYQFHVRYDDLDGGVATEVPSVEDIIAAGPSSEHFDQMFETTVNNMRTFFPDADEEIFRNDMMDAFISG